MKTQSETRRWLLKNGFEVSQKEPLFVFHHHLGVNVRFLMNDGYEFYYDNMTFPVSPDVVEKFKLAVSMMHKLEKFMGF